MNVKEKSSRATKPPSPVPLLRKVSFGAITKKKEEGRTVHPALPDPQGEFAVIAGRIIDRSAQVEALAGALEVDKADLKAFATPFYFSNGTGKIDVPGSIRVLCPSGEVLVTFQNRYGKLDSEEPLLPILGEQTGQFFRQAFTLEIDGDKLPATGAQELLDELQTLFSKYNAGDALKVKECIKPAPDFHTLRHTALTPELNVAVNQVCPIITMVKAKPRPAV